MKYLFLILSTLFTAAHALAWGPKGHDTVAYIAEQHLSKRAAKEIRDILDGKSLVYVANWMDNASHTEEYAHTKTWHYVNVDADEASYAESQHELKGDVVTAINTLIAQLKSGELNRDEERVALMMLIHLVGDMHCPMHAGRKCDRGGNGTQVKYFGKMTKLHSVWDSEIVESAHRWSYSEWQEQVDSATPYEIKQMTQGSPNDWIEESVVLARDVYDNSVGKGNLSYDYVAHYAPIIETQFLKGGLRLAKILNNIY